MLKMTEQILLLLNQLHREQCQAQSCGTKPEKANYLKALASPKEVCSLSQNKTWQRITLDHHKKSFHITVRLDMSQVPHISCSESSVWLYRKGITVNLCMVERFPYSSFCSG